MVCSPGRHSLPSWLSLVLILHPGPVSGAGGRAGAETSASQPGAGDVARTVVPTNPVTDAPTSDLIRQTLDRASDPDDDVALAALRALARWATSPNTEVSGPAADARVRHCDQASRALRRIGATVFTRGDQIVEVVLNGCPVTDDDLRWLRGWPELTDLSLELTPVTDMGIRHLVGLPKLEWLNLYRTRVGDDGLRHLAGLPRLKHLPIGGTRVTDAGLSELKRLKHLEYLGLRGNAITDQGLAALKECPGLTGLHLGGTRITDAGLQHLASLPALQRLWLDGTPISDRAIPHLVSLKKLAELHLDDTRITEDGRRNLRAALPTCRVED